MWSEAASRYVTPIAEIYSAENKLKLQLQVEITLAEVLRVQNYLTQEELDKIIQGSKKVTFSRVNEIDKEIHHDLMAMVKAMAEQSGSAGKKIHIGATSSDIQDTVLAIQLKETKKLILEKLSILSNIMVKLIKTNATIPCIGRTHGQHAAPTTIGFKFANYFYELLLSITNLQRSDVDLAKFSGAVGTNAIIVTPEIEKAIHAKLGLRSSIVSTQVLSRVIHAQFVQSLSLISSVIEKISKEIRNLQRSEINEWREPFKKDQVGSSAMPHKRNPHKSERISGIARIIRANTLPILENISLEHERDISHSSVERIIIPESANLCYYIIDQMSTILSDLDINYDQIKINLKNAEKIKSEQLLKALLPYVGRQEGHEMIKQHIHSSDFKQSIYDDLNITKYLKKSDLDNIFDQIQIGFVQEKIDNLMDYYESTKIWH